MVMTADDEKPTLGKFRAQIPEGDDRHREVCVDCGFVNYENRRSSSARSANGAARSCFVAEPSNRAGTLDLPAGYLEQHETQLPAPNARPGKNARARIAIDSLAAVYTIPRLSQVQLIYQAKLLNDSISAGPESLEVGLFDYADIPWDDLAFPSVHWALGHHRAVAGNRSSPPSPIPPGEVGDLSLKVPRGFARAVNVAISGSSGQ